MIHSFQLWRLGDIDVKSRNISRTVYLVCSLTETLPSRCVCVFPSLWQIPEVINLLRENNDLGLWFRGSSPWPIGPLLWGLWWGTTPCRMEQSSYWMDSVQRRRLQDLSTRFKGQRPMTWKLPTTPYLVKLPRILSNTTDIFMHIPKLENSCQISQVSHVLKIEKIVWMGALILLQKIVGWKKK